MFELRTAGKVIGNEPMFKTHKAAHERKSQLKMFYPDITVRRVGKPVIPSNAPSNLRDRYQLYWDLSNDNYPKTFEEWVNS